MMHQAPAAVVCHVEFLRGTFLGGPPRWWDAVAQVAIEVQGMAGAAFLLPGADARP